MLSNDEDADVEDDPSDSDDDAESDVGEEDDDEAESDSEEDDVDGDAGDNDRRFKWLSRRDLIICWWGAVDLIPDSASSYPFGKQSLPDLSCLQRGNRVAPCETLTFTPLINSLACETGWLMNRGIVADAVVVGTAATENVAQKN